MTKSSPTQQKVIISFALRSSRDKALRSEIRDCLNSISDRSSSEVIALMTCIGNDRELLQERFAAMNISKSAKTQLTELMKRIFPTTPIEDDFFVNERTTIKATPSQQKVIISFALRSSRDKALRSEIRDCLNSISDRSSSEVIALMTCIGENRELVLERVATMNISKSAKLKLNSLLLQLFPPSTDDGFFGDGITSAPYNGC